MKTVLLGLQGLAWVCLCLLVVGEAHAEVKTFSWTLPTKYSDGSVLPITDIQRSTLSWGTSSTAMTNSVVITGSGNTKPVDLAPGTWFAAVKVTAKNTDSPASNIVQVVIVQPAPMPPVLSVQEVVAGINMSPAYRVTSTGERGTTVVGFVPVGTACSGPIVYTYRTKAYRKVPRTAVNWWGTSPTDAVAAACG